MLNFEFKNPTKILFGKGQIANLAKEIPQDAKVMLLYGGGSIKSNGVYEQVKNALTGFDVVEFGGIPANPEYAVLMEALEIIKSQRVQARYFFASSAFCEALFMEYQTEPPMPIPVPRHCITITIGTATFIAERPISPTAFPTKKPSTIE